MTASFKKIAIFIVVAAIAFVFVFSVFVFPAMTDWSMAQSDRIQKQATELIANYHGDNKAGLDQEMVCWDLAYLDRQTLHPEEIASYDGEKVVYTCYYGSDEEERIANDVYTWKDKGSYYYIIREGTIKDEMKVTPWGGLYINGQKCS